MIDRDVGETHELLMRGRVLSDIERAEEEEEALRGLTEDRDRRRAAMHELYWD